MDIRVLPGLATVQFVADMTDETHFTVPQFTLYEDEVQGSGSLTNGTLRIDLDKVGTAAADKITYEGTKQ